VDDALQNVNQARGNEARAKRDFLVAQVNLLWVQGILGESQAESRGAGEPEKGERNEGKAKS
jgi:outer membrane protein TolC